MGLSPLASKRGPEMHHSIPRRTVYTAFLGALAVRFAGPAGATPMAGAGTETGPLEVGVLPYLNLDGLFHAYQPLITHLETALERPVRLVTARNYRHLIDLTARCTYPILITASHFARLAEQDAGYRPILRPVIDDHDRVIVPRRGPVTTVHDLRGRTIAIPDRLALVAFELRSLLQFHGIDPTRDVTIVEAGGHKNAVLAVLNGTVDAAVVSEIGYRHMERTIIDQTRVVSVDPDFDDRPFVPLMILLSPTLSDGEQARIAGVIDAFANYDPAGKAWMRQLQYDGLRAPTTAEMASIDPFVKELRTMLDPQTH